MHIERMTTILADQIAAGEVIERPSSVVKELVENSIDAHSTCIKIDITSKKDFQIIVEDDGHGIFQEDLHLVFARHATSKIRELEDFYSLKTLGFRGEALASIASVARVLLKSRRREEISGSLLEIRGGEMIKRREIPKNPGTFIEVKDLFFNTPARRKHQRAISTEFGHMSSIGTQLALAYPAISLYLYHNQKKIFQTRGQGDLLETITSLYGDRLSSNLLPLSSSEEYMELKGYISSPSYTRKTPSQLFFFVNNRSIKSPFLKKVVEESLRGYLPKGEYPFALFKIQVNPVHIDANVHPQKLTIAFSRPQAIAELLKKALQKVIAEKQSVKALTLKEEETATQKTPLHLSLGFDEKRRDRVQDSKKEETFTRREGTLQEPISIQALDEKLLPLGQLYSTYLLFQGQEALYLMDQHAAHERVLYQRLLDSLCKKKPESQLLLTPFTLQLSPEERTFLEEKEERLIEIGFQWETFGPSSILLRAVPLHLKSLSQEEIKDVIDEIFSQSREREYDLLCILACHGAVKAKKFLDPREMESLLIDLHKTQNPFQCPHGRPTILSMSKKEIEAYFKRS